MEWRVRMGDSRTALPPQPDLLTELRRRCWDGRQRQALTGLALAAAAVWGYWPALAQLADKWLHDPQYSHGLLVSPFAVYLLWVRRDRFPARALPAPLPGLLLLLAGC